jgi:demethylsterigmatocystin 6-O-methyltransferase
MVEYSYSDSSSFDMIGPVLQALPGHLKAQGYRSVSEMDQTAMQAAFHTDLSAFDYIKRQPHLFMDMQQVMTIQRTTAQWFEVAPFNRELPTLQGENVAFVDIGGGRGHQCEALKKQHPHLSDHIVLQDLPETLKGLESIQGVELMAHDFLTPQPVKGYIVPQHKEPKLTSAVPDSTTSARCSTTGRTRNALPF